MCTVFNRASVSALLLLLAVGGLHGRPAHAQPLTTAFIYQGELQMAGLPASGPHDLRFRLYDAAAGGLQIGTTLCSDNVALAAARFTVSLDFGAAFAGQQRFLEIEARADTGLDCLNAAGFVILGPRQPLTAAPNAAFALTAASATTAATATNATQLNGQAAAFYQNAANLSAGTLSDLRLSANVALLNNAQTFTGAKTLSNAANLFTGTFTGSGSALTGLNASNIASGTLTDLRLSSNAALLNNAQTFTAAKTFSTAPLFTAAGSPFSVTSTTLVANLNADLLDGLNSTAFLQSVPNPLTLSGTSATHIIRGTNASTANGSSGVFGESAGISGATSGVYGRGTSTAGTGVQGEATATTGLNYGGRFESASTSGRGVFGDATASTGPTYGVYGRSDSTLGRGVYGTATAASGPTFGVIGQNSSVTGFGVMGEVLASTGVNYGVTGQTSSSNAGAFGVYAFGRLGASGVKSFRIDHPADPENKYLLHYSAESPKVISFYRGTVTLDGGGEAIVELPAYFASINKEPSYTLTAVGAPMPLLHVAEKISAADLSVGAAAQPG